MQTTIFIFITIAKLSLHHAPAILVLFVKAFHLIELDTNDNVFFQPKCDMFPQIFSELKLL